MSAGDLYLTQDGYEKLIKELEYLKNVRRKELSKEIEKARGYGDLSENAEYDAAKDAQAMNEKRVAELESKLSRARILDNEKITNDEVLIGATVSLKDLDTAEELAYTLVSEEEADYSQGKISISSPVGKGLLNHKAGEEVEIKIPAGVLKYQIVKISR